MQTPESFEHDPGLEYGVLAPEIAADNMAREMAKEEQPGPPEEVEMRLRLEGEREVVASRGGDGGRDASQDANKRPRSDVPNEPQVAQQLLSVR